MCRGHQGYQGYQGHQGYQGEQGCPNCDTIVANLADPFLNEFVSQSQGQIVVKDLL